MPLMAQLTATDNWQKERCSHKQLRMKDDSRMTSDAFELHGPERKARYVITCDHASNRVPEDVAGGDLGLAKSEMARHIAFDIGAAGLTRALADALDAPAILSTFSRLVIDPNRGEEDPTIIMQIYDRTIIPGNRRLTAEERFFRKARYYSPYHEAYRQLVAARKDPIIIPVHSFTPQLKGRSPRPWDVGILSAHDRRLTDPFLHRLRQEPDLCVGDNEPYLGHLPGDAVDRHALSHGHLNALIEIRQDLVENVEDQRAWGERLAKLLSETVVAAAL